MLVNDRDPDGAGLIATVFDPPDAGLLSLARDGSFQFDPPEEPGELTFTYVVSDGGTASAPAVVLIDVLPDDAPTDTGEPQRGDTGDTGAACTPITWYADQDGDGYGNPEKTTLSCQAPDGYVEDRTDCDDQDPAVYPGASEVPGDNADQDCDTYDVEIEAIGACTTGRGPSTWLWLLVPLLGWLRRRTTEEPVSG